MKHFEKQGVNWQKSMSQKDGYQQYLDQAARAANASGAAHHDPAVRARQGLLSGGIIPQDPNSPRPIQPQRTEAPVAPRPAQATVPGLGMDYIRQETAIDAAIKLLIYAANQRQWSEAEASRIGTNDPEKRVNEGFRSYLIKKYNRSLWPIQEINSPHFYTGGIGLPLGSSEAKIFEHLANRRSRRAAELSEARNVFRRIDTDKHFAHLLQTKWLEFKEETELSKQRRESWHEFDRNRKRKAFWKIVGPIIALVVGFILLMNL